MELGEQKNFSWIYKIIIKKKLIYYLKFKILFLKFKKQIY